MQKITVNRTSAKRMGDHIELSYNVKELVSLLSSNNNISFDLYPVYGLKISKVVFSYIPLKVEMCVVDGEESMMASVSVDKKHVGDFNIESGELEDLLIRLVKF